MSDIEPRTVFLDRDGTINRPAAAGRVIRSAADLEFLPGAVEGLALLKQAGFRLILVTNQPGVAAGEITLNDVTSVHCHMQRELRSSGAALHRIYYCAHAEAECECPKPK